MLFEFDEEFFFVLVYLKFDVIRLLLFVKGWFGFIDLEMVCVNLFSFGFVVIIVFIQCLVKVLQGVYYWGVVRGVLGLVVVLSFFEDEVMGLISIFGQGNFVFGKNQEVCFFQEYILYNDYNVFCEMFFDCVIFDDVLDYCLE